MSQKGHGMTKEYMEYLEYEHEIGLKRPTKMTKVNIHENAMPLK